MKLNLRWILPAALLSFVAIIIFTPMLAGAFQQTSERQWMRDNGQKHGETPGIWFWRVQTHNYPDWPQGADPQKPETCVGCHSWVEGATITQGGFTNAFGETPGVENQDISPKALLDSAIHVDASGNKTFDNKHAEYYDTYGCAACHSDHGPVENFGCANCHGNPEEAPEMFAQMHGTHPALLEAEMPLGDPEDFKNGKPSCQFCHANQAPEGPTSDIENSTLLPLIENPAVGSASCWNCHMSAHKPVNENGAAYWKATPTVTAPPLTTKSLLK